MVSEDFTVSVILTNYNYESFVGQAIDSALALDWPSVEVVVVDDGSTDGSRKIIASYGSKIKTILQNNGGQISACNAGFAASTGDAIIFLDSDDLLYSSIVREIAKVWRPGLSRIKSQLQIVDQVGKPTGSVLPQYYFVPSPVQTRKWAIATGAYQGPPGSTGSAYTREYLNKIFPLDQSCGPASDSICVTAAPFLGDVVSIPKPLAAYRIHGRNDGAMLRLNIDHMTRSTERCRLCFSYAQKIAKTTGIIVRDEALNKRLHYLEYRLASLKLMPARHPVKGDSLLQVLMDVLKGAMTPQGYSPKAILTLVVWAFAVGLSPRTIAYRLTEWRFVPTTRPKVLQRMLKAIKV